MTDADRKRAFDICTGDYLACEDDCPYAKHGFSIGGCLREHRKYMRDEINRQKAEIFNLNKENSALKLKNDEFLKSNEKAKAEIEKKDTEIEILIRKKEALRDEISELTAEVERLQKIIVGFMDEVGTWSNKYDVDISNIHKLPLLAKEDLSIKNKIKSEAYREFADLIKAKGTPVTGGKGFEGVYVMCSNIVIDNTLKELTDQTATNQSVSLMDGHIEG